MSVPSEEDLWAMERDMTIRWLTHSEAHTLIAAVRELRGYQEAFRRQEQETFKALQETDELRAEVETLRKERDERDEAAAAMSVTEAGTVPRLVFDASLDAVKQLRADRDRLRAALDRVGGVLASNGCDCECDHHHDEHESSCERCLGCRVQEAMSARDATIPGRVEMYREPIAATPGCACVTCRRLAEYETSPEGMSDAPYVCPGCHAVATERCLPGCIDAEIEAEHRHAIESGNYDRTEHDDDREAK